MHGRDGSINTPRRHPSNKRMSIAVITVAQENTYQLEPRRRFQSFKAKRAAQSIVEKYLKQDTEYSKELESNLAVQISQEVLQHLKGLYFDRYRYVVQTYMGEKKNQGVQVASRALCDGQLDSYAEYLFENNYLWCVVLVHGMYFE